MVHLLSVILILTAPAFAYAANCDEESLCENLNDGFQPEIKADELPEARIERLVEEAKTRLPQVILRGRKPEQATESEKKILKAFAGVGILSPVTDKVCRNSCAIDGYATYFVHPRSGMCICPKSLKNSDETLLMIIAHEVAHAGDICAFENTGLLPGQHPFESAASGGTSIQCMETNGVSGGGSAEEPDEINKRLKAPNARQLSALFSYDSAKQLERKSYGHTHCYGPFGKSQMREASADLFSFQVLGSYLKDHPFPRRHPDNFLRAFGPMLTVGCRGRSDSDRRRQSTVGHPPVIERITKIALSVPDLRRALGCTDAAIKDCDYRPGGAAGSGSSPSTTR